MTDPFAALEASAVATRAAQRALRQTPAVRAKRQRGRIQKRRGYAAEVLVVKAMQRAGLDAARQPLSGALGGSHAGDVVVGWDGRTLRGEVKRRAGADRGLRAQLAQGAADFLVRVPGGGGEPLVVVTLPMFLRLLGGTA